VSPGAINVPLAHRGESARWSVVVVIVAALRGLDVDVDGVRDGLVCTARFVLVDHGRPLTVVVHPRHEIAQARAAGRCDVACAVQRHGMARVDLDIVDDALVDRLCLRSRYPLGLLAVGPITARLARVEAPYCDFRLIDAV
jgi:hypothetical protein